MWFRLEGVSHMDSQYDFGVIFESIQNIASEDFSLENATPAEIDDIDELRRWSLEISAPPSASYTCT